MDVGEKEKGELRELWKRAMWAEPSRAVREAFFDLLLVLHAWFLFGVFRACGPGPCLAWSGPRTCLTASLNNPSNLIYLLGSHARMPAPAITIYLIFFQYPLRITLVSNPSKYRDLFKGLISINRWFFVHSRYIKLSILYLSGLSIYHLCRTVLVLFIY